MEFWANLEHRLRYKKDLDSDILTQISEELTDCAETISDLDNRMQKIKDIIDN